MYMMTKGKSRMPLIKLSEGCSIENGKSNNRYVTIVTGSQGEAVSPVKIWSNKPFEFFKKELLNAEFVSKTELTELKAYFNNANSEVRIVIKKFKVPAYMVENSAFDEATIKKADPVTETVAEIKINMSAKDLNNVIAYNMEFVCGGCFIEATKAVIAKVKAMLDQTHENKLFYYKKN